MGINIRWENEFGKVLEEVPDPRNCLALALALSSLDETVCLRFIDPYGDTVFNQQQIPVLIQELQWLMQLITPNDVASLQDQPFRVYNLKTGQTENRVRVEKVSADEVMHLLTKIIELANQSNGATHTYLKFYGD
uniref:Uncharacterized protein n=1 Tax=Oscillatoriales cyanobacterium SpSt-402 TaxID=2282168 RepID=A0A832H3Q0_9CYAN